MTDRRTDQLIPKMRAYAAAHPDCEHFIELADKLEAALSAPEGEWSAKKVLGCWARARRAWCEKTGEPLV